MGWRIRSLLIGRAGAISLLATFALLGEHPAAAQSQPASPVGPGPGQLKVFRIDIAAKPLPQAMADLSTQTGLQVLYTEALPFQRQAPAVKGSYTAEQALNLMLAGSGMTYRFTAANAVTLQKLPVGTTGALILPPVQVEGQTDSGAQSPYGPGVGYVATQSVLGTKTDTPIVETPQSISVVTRQQMNDQQPQNLNQALRYTPGIVPEALGVTSSYNVQGALQMRGFDPDIYLDGLKNENNINFGTFAVNPYLLDRIEVLGGPASVLYGQASPGGLVNMSSKLPTDTPLHEVQLGGGSYGQYQGAFDVGGPLDEGGEFLYRVTGIGFSEKTQTDFTKQQSVAIAPAFTWRPDEDTDLTILGKYIYSPALGSYALVPARGTVLSNPNGTISSSFFSGDPDYYTETQTIGSIGYRFEHRFGDAVSFTQNVRYSHVEGKEKDLQPAGLEADLRTLDRYAFYNSNRNDTVLVDNQLHAELDTGPVSQVFTVGLDYQRIAVHNLYGFNFVDIPPIDIFSPDYHVSIPSMPAEDLGTTDTQLSQIGVYGQDQFKFGNWRLLLGAREDWSKEHFVFTATVGENRMTQDQSEHAFTWRAGVVYLFDNGLAPYFSYSTSFQPQAQTTFEGTPFVPTTAQQYEIGLKYQPPGHDSFVAVSAYNLTEQNVSTADPDPAHAGFSIQTGEIRARGVELQAHASLTDELSVIASYTYTNAINTKSSTTDVTVDGDVVSTQGKHPTAVPEHMASLWANYTFHDGPARGLGLGAGVRYVGSSYGDAANSFEVPGFTLFDAALQYDLGEVSPSLEGLRLQLNATNLLDKSYISSCGGQESCYHGLRRTVLATLTYNW